MSAAGLGVDIVEIERIRRVLERTPRFRERVYSAGERAYCDKKARPEVHYALRFAAKEAVLKALGTGFGNGINITDVEVANDRFGRPYPILHGGAKRVADELGVREMYLSLSYTSTLGVANAFAVTDDARPKVEEERDSKAELAQAFKEARTLLDELDGPQADQSAADADTGEGTDEAPE